MRCQMKEQVIRHVCVEFQGVSWDIQLKSLGLHFYDCAVNYDILELQ